MTECKGRNYLVPLVVAVAASVPQMARAHDTTYDAQGRLQSLMCTSDKSGKPHFESTVQYDAESRVPQSIRTVIYNDTDVRAPQGVVQTLSFNATGMELKLEDPISGLTMTYGCDVNNMCHGNYTSTALENMRALFFRPLETLCFATAQTEPARFRKLCVG